MSSNDFIRISKIKNRYVVKRCDMDTGNPFSTYVLDSFAEARKKARKLDSGEDNELGLGSEYGIEIDENCFDE